MLKKVKKKVGQTHLF